MEIKHTQAFEDNYIYFLIENNEAVLVDPGDSTPVFAFLHKYELKLVGILATHHHNDHVGGIKNLTEKHPAIPVWGSAQDKGRVPGQTHFLKDKDSFQIFDKTCEVIFVPGHTAGHILFYFKESDDLFCGDTLFGGGCGKIFEGTFEQMFAAMKKIKSLPPQTKIWCGHEYTRKNLTLALQLEPHNRQLIERLAQLSNISVPLLLQDELDTNPFLRFDSADIQDSLKTQGDEFKTFVAVREFRDKF